MAETVQFKFATTDFLFDPNTMYGSITTVSTVYSEFSPKDGARQPLRAKPQIEIWRKL